MVEIIFNGCAPFYFLCFFYLFVLTMLISLFWRKQHDSVVPNLPNSIKKKNTYSIALVLGSYIDVQDSSGVWLEGKIKNIDSERIFVHYLGWETKWDEWIYKKDSLRYAPLHTFSKPKKILDKSQQKTTLNEDLRSKHLNENQIDTIITDLKDKKVQTPIIWYLKQKLEEQTEQAEKNQYMKGDTVEIFRNSGGWTEAKIVDINHVKQLYSVKWQTEGLNCSKIVSKNELRPLSYVAPTNHYQYPDVALGTRAESQSSQVVNLCSPPSWVPPVALRKRHHSKYNAPKM